jgi:NAD(P)-dependent dehydrogenase (short-subunit alcohol dehydrogenase family)
MQKTILITGATDGLGLEAAKLLAAAGHHVLLHGRNRAKLEKAVEAVQGGEGRVEQYVADLSRMTEVESLADAVLEHHDSLDVLINNAGVFRTGSPITEDGLDIRFVVNTIAPFLLTRRLLPLLSASSRVVNLSSAAQAPVKLRALGGEIPLSDNAAYAQSKLALTMWSRALALSLGKDGPSVIAVNPGSMLGTKMVKEAFGVPGGDVRIGADILYRAALSDEFATASGKYFDNDAGRFAPPHPDVLDADKSADVVRAIETILAK